MTKTATIFAYKGNLGMIVSAEGKFINDPFAPGQLGAVISTNEVENNPPEDYKAFVDSNA